MKLINNNNVLIATIDKNSILRIVEIPDDESKLSLFALLKDHFYNPLYTAEYMKEYGIAYNMVTRKFLIEKEV